MDIDTRLEILKLYYKNGDSATAALRAYNGWHGKPSQFHHMGDREPSTSNNKKPSPSKNLRVDGIQCKLSPKAIFL